MRKARKDKGLTQAALAKLVGVKADAVSGWENDAHFPRPAERRRIARHLPELADAVKAYRSMRISSRGEPATVAERTGQGVEVDDAPGGVFDMNGAARRIAEAIEKDLHHSEALIGSKSPTELERQRALVWALKDLARWLHNHDFHMANLFNLTDEMAREIGLPVRPPSET